MVEFMTVPVEKPFQVYNSKILSAVQLLESLRPGLMLMNSLTIKELMELAQKEIDHYLQNP